VSVTPCCVAPLALPGPHGDASVPNVCAEALEVPELPDGAAVVGVDDEEPRLLLQAEASIMVATTATNPMNMRLLCFTDPPCQRRITSRRRSNMTIASLAGRKGVGNVPKVSPRPAGRSHLRVPGTDHL
jgi:hypothetical protein